MRSSRSVLSRARTSVVVVAVAALGVLMPSAARAQGGDKTFSGLYLAADAGRQHVIGGSLVDGVDTLQDDTRTVLSVAGGLRLQFGGVVLGGELGYGRTDGDLLLEDPSRLLTIDYSNDSQWHWALTAGHTLGAGTLLFGYLSEVTREFDVNILRVGARTEQSDEQGMLRFGGGVEQRLVGPLHLRLMLGTSRADFGGRDTNVEIGRKLEFSGGVVIQF